MIETISLPEYPGTRFIVQQDEWADSPIADYPDVVELLVYRGGYNSVTSKEGTYSMVFERLLDSLGDADKALSALKRYAIIFHGWDSTKVDDHFIIFHHTGYSQGDWLDVFIAVDDSTGGYGKALGYAEEWSMWARGDVYTVQTQTRIVCESPDLCHGGDDSHWLEGETLCGIYSDDYAEGAVKEFIANGCLN